MYNMNSFLASAYRPILVTGLAPTIRYANANKAGEDGHKRQPILAKTDTNTGTRSYYNGVTHTHAES